MRVIQGTVLLSTCALLLTACGDPTKLNEANLESALQEFIDSEIDQFRVELPLNNVRLTDGSLALDMSTMNLDFAVLQLAANRGKLERSDESLSSTRFQILGDDQTLIHRHPSGRPTIVLGRTGVQDIVGFTDATENGDTGQTHATVVFENIYADWLAEDDVQALRTWTAMAAGESGNPSANPAFRSYPAVFSEMAFGSMLAAVSDQGIFSLPQESVYWSNLALESFSMKVPFLRTDDGWTPIADFSKWELQDIKGVGNLTRRDVENALESMFQTIVGPIEKARRPSDESVMAAAKSRLSGPMLYQTPLQGNGELTCIAEHGTDLMGRKTDVEYSCSPETIEKLEIMMDNDHLHRSVPKAGEVHYSIAEDLRPHLKSNGQLELGSYEVGSVGDGSVALSPNGFSTYRFEVELRPSAFDWASPYLPEAKQSSRTVRGGMVHANGKWVAASQ